MKKIITYFKDTTITGIIVIIPIFFCANFLPAQAQSLPEVEISAEELRGVLDDYFFYFVGNVEATMDSISNSTDDLKISRAAVIFKTYGIAEAQRSVFVKDPLVGLFDLGFLIIQLENYYGGDHGDRLFGTFKPQVVSLIRELKSVVIKVTFTLNPNWDTQVAIDALAGYSEEYPLLNDYFGRKSVRRIFDHLKVQQKIKLKELAVDMAASVDVMTIRLNYYMALIPKQMRWQMELAAYNLALDPTWQIDVDSLAGKFGVDDWVDSFMVDIFSKISTEREMVFLGIDDLKSSSFDDLDSRSDSLQVWLENYSFALTEEVNVKIDSSMIKFEGMAALQVTSTLNQTEAMMNRLLIRVFVGLLALILAYALLRTYVIHKPG
jgi:hypothetical protein